MLKRSRAARVGCLTLALFLVLLVVMLLPRQPNYVVEAETEYLFLSDFGPDSDWRIDGFTLCRIEAGSIFDSEGGGCTPETLPQEPVLTIDPRTEAAFKRLRKEQLEIQLEGHPRPPDPHKNNEPNPTATLETFGGEGPAPKKLFGTIILRRSDSNGMLPLEFGARATIGQVPSAGAAGLLLRGTVSLFQNSVFNAGRFEVETVRLVLGDAVSAYGADPKKLKMRGVVRFAPADKEGLQVAYAGNTDRLSIERMRSRYDIKIPWTARFVLDPLMTALIAIFGLIATFSAAAVFFLESSGWRGKPEHSYRRGGTV